MLCGLALLLIQRTAVDETKSRKAENLKLAYDRFNFHFMFLCGPRPIPSIPL